MEIYAGHLLTVRSHGVEGLGVIGNHGVVEIVTERQDVASSLKVRAAV